jgi:polar amino acid transport system substrate-binding protein
MNWTLVAMKLRKQIYRGLLALSLIGLLFTIVLSLPVLSNPASPVISPPNTSKTLRVATRVIAPFVMQNNNQLTGFSIDLWDKIRQELGQVSSTKISSTKISSTGASSTQASSTNSPIPTLQNSKITVYNTLPEMLGAVRDGKADLAIAAISITAEREAQFDFSYPIFNSGLQILVRTPKKSGAFVNVFKDLLSPSFLQLIGLAIAMVLFASHLIWVLERRHPNSSIAPSYFPGIFEAAWWAASTLATQAEEMPKGVMGRVMAVMWMFVSVLFVAYFTATVTASMTVESLQGDIKSIADLKGRSIATIDRSSAAEFLQSQPVTVVPVNKIDDAYTALLTEKVDAVVFDGPVLQYYAIQEGKGKVEVVGDLLRRESYGIALATGNPDRKAINSALLKLHENGTYQALYDRWFKADRSS